MGERVEHLPIICCPLAFCSWMWYGDDPDVADRKEREHWDEYHADQGVTRTQALGDVPSAAD